VIFLLVQIDTGRHGYPSQTNFNLYPRLFLCYQKRLERTEIFSSHRTSSTKEGKCALLSSSDDGYISGFPTFSPKLLVYDTYLLGISLDATFSMRNLTITLEHGTWEARACG